MPYREGTTIQLKKETKKLLKRFWLRIPREVSQEPTRSYDDLILGMIYYLAGEWKINLEENAFTKYNEF